MDTTCRVSRNIYTIPVFVFFPEIHREARRCKKTIYKVNLDKIHINIWGKVWRLGRKTSHRARLKKKFQKSLPLHEIITGREIKLSHRKIRSENLFDLENFDLERSSIQGRSLCMYATEFYPRERTIGS